MKSLRESLLSDIENTLSTGDVTADEMCKLNYRLQYFVCQAKFLHNMPFFC